MLGDLNQDIMGTNPKYPPLANLDYLTVDPATYDNYPSDNESVRIQPKLADLWNHNKKQCGINLVPNQTVQSLGMRSADVKENVTNFCCETKKAMMMGYTGKRLAEYLRARFDKDTIESAKEEMVKLSEEQGLLGNVYIDASAFSSSRDAEQFLTMHRNRLAQDIVVNDSAVNQHVIGFLANKFHKNVVNAISYDTDLFDKYKIHLVNAGNIDSDYVIDSKESLRLAFLAEPVKEIVKTASTKDVKHASKEEIAQELANRAESTGLFKKLAAEDLLFRNVHPIIKFTRIQLTNGKIGSDLKEVLRGKYASSDLQDAAKYIAVVISKDITSERIDKLVEANRFSEKVGDELKDLIKKYPLKVQAFEEESKPERQIGTPGHFHVMLGQTDNLSEYHQSSVELLRKGKDFNEVKEVLLKKLSNDEAEKILLGAVKAFNETPAGTIANAPVVVPKVKVVADLEEPISLPDEKTIMSQTQEYMDFYKGSEELVVDVDKRSSNTGLIEIEGLESKSGVDGVL